MDAQARGKAWAEQWLGEKRAVTWSHRVLFLSLPYSPSSPTLALELRTTLGTLILLLLALISISCEHRMCHNPYYR